jgi:hypothetical protein
MTLPKPAVLILDVALAGMAAAVALLARAKHVELSGSRARAKYCCTARGVGKKLTIQAVRRHGS